MFPSIWKQNEYIEHLMTFDFSILVKNYTIVYEKKILHIIWGKTMI